MVQLFRRRQGTSIQTYKHANIVLLYKRDIATQCLFASMYVCLQPISSITAGLIWLNFFCQLHLGHRVVLGQKNSGSGIQFFRKSRKIWILGYYSTNLAEKSLNVQLQSHYLDKRVRGTGEGQKIKIILFHENFSVV